MTLLQKTFAFVAVLFVLFNPGQIFAAGEACSDDEPCVRDVDECSASGFCVVIPGLCAEDLDCPTGDVCETGIGVCIPDIGEDGCLETSDCPFGQECIGNECVQLLDSCTEDADCLSGEICSATGNCIQPPAGFCRTNSDCSGEQVCVQELCVTPQADSSNEEGASFSSIRGAARDLNPFGGISVQTLLGRIIATGMGIMGSIALIMMIVGGVMFMTASGKPGAIDKALKVMAWAAIGAITILVSYAIVTYVLLAFT